MSGGLMGVYTIWLRDLRKFWRDRPRIVGSMFQPFLYLVLLGTGIGRAFGPLHTGTDYLQFIFPGILAMTVLFTSVFSAVSIIWDREVGFLKEVLVAPIPRWSVVVGKTLGGSTIAMLQGGMMLVLAPLAGVALSWGIVANLLPLMLLLACALTAMGLSAAAPMRSMQGFTMIMNFLTLPMFFLSGALFPTRALPQWMALLVHLNPLTYGVDLIRGAVSGLSDMTWLMNLSVVTGFGAAMLVAAVLLFQSGE